MPASFPGASAGDVWSESTHVDPLKTDLDALFDGWPTRAMMEHQTSTVTAGAALADGAATATHVLPQWRQNPSAVGNAWTNAAVLAAGTYTLYLYCVTTNASGQLDLSLSIVGTIATAMEFYSGSTVEGVYKTVSGIVIPSLGRYVLTGTVSGKNVSSSSYDIRISRMWFKQASD